MSGTKRDEDGGMKKTGRRPLRDTRKRHGSGWRDAMISKGRRITCRANVDERWKVRPRRELFYYGRMMYRTAYRAPPEPFFSPRNMAEDLVFPGRPAVRVKREYRLCHCVSQIRLRPPKWIFRWPGCIYRRYFSEISRDKTSVHRRPRCCDCNSGTVDKQRVAGQLYSALVT